MMCQILTSLTGHTVLPLLLQLVTATTTTDSSTTTTATTTATTTTSTVESCWFHYYILYSSKIEYCSAKMLADTETLASLLYSSKIEESQPVESKGHMGPIAVSIS